MGESLLFKNKHLVLKVLAYCDILLVGSTSSQRF